MFKIDLLIKLSVCVYLLGILNGLFKCIIHY